MSNKRMKIEDLENLQEITTEEFSSIQGGLSIQKIDEISIHPDHPIEWDPKPVPLPYPHPIPLPCNHKPFPYPLPIDDHYPKKPIKYPIHIGWCPVIL